MASAIRGMIQTGETRLRRTAEVMDAIAWGPRADADRLTRRVRAMHRRVRGTLPEDAGPFPAGTPYAADDPELLLWVLACLVDSAVLVYEKCVGRLSAEEKEFVKARLYEDVGHSKRHEPLTLKSVLEVFKDCEQTSEFRTRHALIH